MNIQLSDAYTGSKNCTDKNHWLLIGADVFVPQGSSDDIFLTLPDDFKSLPESSFPLKRNSKSIGSVTSNGTNVLKVSTEGSTAANVTASFSFLAQLTSDAKDQIQSPGEIDYTFEVSSGSKFTTSVDYVALDLSTLTSNGGINAENSSAWFTANIPVSLTSSPVYFTSQETANTTYEFNTAVTSVEIVVAVDAFNQPKLSFPFTAYKDLSDSSHIKLLFNTTINGGKYLRVNYSTNSLETESISNTISLDYASELRKRDSSITVTSNLYSSPDINVQNQGSSEDVASETSKSGSSLVVSTTQEVFETYSLETTTEPGIFTEVGSWVPISTLSDSLSTKTTSSSEVISKDSASASFTAGESVVSSTVSSSDQTSNISTSSTERSVTTESLTSPITDATKSTLSSSSSNLISTTAQAETTGSGSHGALFGSKANVSEEYLTYLVFTTTINDQVITLTSLTPISTISSKLPSVSVLYSNETTNSQLTLPTLDYTSTALPSTVSDTAASPSSALSSVTSFVVNPSKLYSNSTATKSPQSTTKAEPDSIKTQERSSYETYSVISKDGSGVLTTYTKVRPISTLKVTSSRTSAKVVKTQTSSRRSIATKDDSGVFTTYTSVRPLSTLSASSALNTNHKTSNRLSTATQNGCDQGGPCRLSTSVTTSVPQSILRQTSTSSQAASQLTNSDISTTISLLIQTQLTSSGDWQSSQSVLMYQDGADRASGSLSGLLVGLGLLWVL